MKNLIIILFSFLLHVSYGQTFQVKRALDNLAEGDIEKAEDLIVKAYEKDSLDPSVKYAMSLLYENPDYEKNDIDKAYYFILETRKSLDSLDSKEIEKLEKTGLNRKSVNKHQHLLDSQAFIISMELNTVESYNRFIRKHPEASEIEEAIEMRNEAAWKIAVGKDTYSAYRNFIENYPKAEQVPEANKRYERLYFRALTNDGRLNSYKELLQINPDTPFRDVAEREILELSTVSNNAEAYIHFLTNYPKSKHFNDARDVFYHLQKETGFLEFRKEWWTDSLNLISEIGSKWFIPVFKDGTYRFLTLNGDYVLENGFETIDADLICEGKYSDFIFLPGNPSKFYNLNGDMFFEDIFTSAKDLGFGIIKTQKFGKSGAIHKRGTKILSTIYSDIKIIDGSFIAYKENGFWGLVSFFGRDILDPLYDNIETVNNSIILTLNGRNAITTKEEISKAANDMEPNFIFIYDEYELWANNKIWVRSGRKEGLINDKSAFVLELDDQRIIEVKNGYIAEKNDQTVFYDLNFEKEDGGYSEIITNSSFQIYKKNNESYLLNLQTSQVNKYDSLRLLGESYAISALKYNDIIIFPNGKTHDLSYTDKYQLIGNPGHEYILVKSQRNKTVYNSKGNSVIEGNFSDVTASGNNYLIVEERNQKRLYDSEGNSLLRTYFETIVPDKSEGVTLLRDGEIGYYNIMDTVYFSPKFDKKVERMNNQLYKVSVEGKTGLLNKKDEYIIPAEFTEIKYWNDSSYVVTGADFSTILNPFKQDTLFSNIDELRVLEVSENESIYEFTSEGNSGIISNVNGIIIPPAYTFIRNAGKVYIAEKYFREADYYIIVYYDLSGKILRKQGLNKPDYESIYCEE